ncbi:MAG: alpha/beta hydrolase [Calditrichia bacterium]
MTWIWAILILMAIILLFDIWIKKVYSYPKRQHRTTPEEFGIPFEEVRFPTEKQLDLYGWWIPASEGLADTAPVIILAHGWGRNVEDLLPYIQKLHPMGYYLLAIDLRNHGSSDPDKYPNMLKFSEDIRAAVDFVHKKQATATPGIGVFGISAGGAAAIHAASFDKRIQSVVTVGAFAHPIDIMKMEFRKRHIPYFPVVWLMFKYLELRIGLNFNRIAPVNNIGRVGASIFLIHGSRDEVVPPQQAHLLMKAANKDRATLWLVPDTGHSNCNTHPEFWEKVESFLNKTLAQGVAIAK